LVRTKQVLAIGGQGGQYLRGSELGMCLSPYGELRGLKRVKRPFLGLLVRNFGNLIH